MGSFPCSVVNIKMSEQQVEIKKRRTFRKYTYRGVDLDQLLDLPPEQLMELVHARARRRFSRGLKRKPLAFMKRLSKERSPSDGKAGGRKNPSPKHDHCTRDGRQRGW